MVINQEMKEILNKYKYWTIVRRHFKRGTGIDLPENAFWTAGAIAGFFKEMATLIAKYPGYTMSELILSLRTEATLAVMFGEIALVVGALTAAFFVGFFIGCLITAYQEYYEFWELPVLRDLKLSQANEILRSIDGGQVNLHNNIFMCVKSLDVNLALRQANPFIGASYA